MVVPLPDLRKGFDAASTGHQDPWEPVPDLRSQRLSHSPHLGLLAPRTILRSLTGHWEVPVMEVASLAAV